MQALIYALEMARVRLRLNPDRETALTWCGLQDLGLPTMLPNSPVP